MNWRTLLVLCLSFCWTGVAVAEEVTVQWAATEKLTVCKMSTGSLNQGNLIGEEIFLARDSANGSVRVFVGVIARNNEPVPLVASVKTDTAAKLIVVWLLQIHFSDGARANVQYSATLFHATNELQVNASPPGFRSVSARGKCKPYKG